MRYLSLVFSFLFSLQSFAYISNKIDEVLLDTVINGKESSNTSFIADQKISSEQQIVKKKKKKKVPNQINKKKKGKKSKNRKNANKCFKW